MTSTWLTERFGLSVPVISAPMAGPAEGRLAAAVSTAEGLGMIGAGGSRDPEWIQAQAAIAAESGKPFGIGLMAWALESNPAQIDAVIAAEPSLVSVSFGAFESYVVPLREAGIATTTQAGNLDDALRAEQAGVDFVVARGGEAGGHGRNDIGTLALLQLVLDRVHLPVVAAGGIGNARGLSAVLAAGAVGAWVGTAFLCCYEASNSSAARRQLLASSETAYGRVFDVAQRLDWPAEYGGRALRNDFFATWDGRLDELGRDDAATHQLTEARAVEDFATAHLYAGQGVGLLTQERSAADVLADFANID